MTGRLTRVLIGTLVVLLSCIGVAWASVERGNQGGSSATCSEDATINFAGREYGWWDAVRVPQPWGPLGDVQPPDCYQGDGPFSAYEITGVDPEVALLVRSPDGLSVWLESDYRTGRKQLPDAIGVLGLPAACAMTAPMEVIAVVRQVDPPIPAGAAAVNPPYTVALQVSGAGVGYSSDALVTVQGRVTDATRGGRDAALLREARYQSADGTTRPHRVIAELHCDGEEWMVDALRPL